MKTIGLIGGMSWKSTIEYYRIINQEINCRLGGLSSAQIVLFSLDFQLIAKLEASDNWKEIEKIIAEVAKKAAMVSVDCLLLCANTIHKVASTIQRNTKIPLIHIAHEVAIKVRQSKLHKVGLLGTKYTMEDEFIRGPIEEMGIEVLIPSNIERQTVHNIIFNELVHGEIKVSSKEQYIQIIESLKRKGAQGIILGCTEIPLLIKEGDISLPIFDSTQIHSEAAVDFVLD